MRKIFYYFIGFLLLHNSAPLLAGDLGINVILSGDIQPGVYGEVEFYNAPRPVVVYERPVVVYQDRRYIREEPVYLHVPPDHSRYWSRHCRDYHACGRRVYFVKSREYEPQYHGYERERRHYVTHQRRHHRDDDRYERHGHHHKHHLKHHHKHDHHDRDDDHDDD